MDPPWSNHQVNKPNESSQVWSKSHQQQKMTIGTHSQDRHDVTPVSEDAGHAEQEQQAKERCHRQDNGCPCNSPPKDTQLVVTLVVHVVSSI